MSNRNLESQALDAAREAIARRDRRGYSAGSGAVTAAERADSREGIRIAAIVRERQTARDLAELTAAARAAGVPISEAAEAAEAESLATLAEAEQRAAKFGAPRGKWTLVSEERMTDRQLWAILTAAASATASAINRRVNKSARLSDDEYADLRQWLSVVALEKGAPKWRAILTDDDSAAAAAAMTRAERAETLRQRWIATLILHGRQWRAERAERMTAESAELTAEHGEGATVARINGKWVATPAVTPAERAAAEHSEAVVTVDALSAHLSAAKRPLTTAEGFTLAMDLQGLSRREAAERAGITQDSAKKNAQRGRKHLAERWPSVRVMRADLARLAERTTANDVLERPRGADVIRWIDAAESAVSAAITDAWTDLARRSDDSAKRPERPRAGRRILPMRPRVNGRAALDAPRPWHLANGTARSGADALAEWQPARHTVALLTRRLAPTRPVPPSAPRPWTATASKRHAAAAKRYERAAAAERAAAIAERIARRPLWSLDD